MNMKSNEEILTEIANTRNHTLRTTQTYQTAMKDYCRFHQMTMYELLQEAEDEERSMIRWKDRKLKERLINYRQYLVDNYLLSTARNRLIRVKNIYKFYEIELQDLPYLSTKTARENPPLTFKDLPDKQIIQKAIKVSNPLITAIILFISSSGCGRTETLNLKIGDFIESLQEYTSETDIYKIINELHSRDDLVPIFKLKRQKTNQYYYTFCSPEATTAIMDYLLTRDEYLNPDKQLFKVSVNYLSNKLGATNDHLGLGKKSGFKRLRCHMLRKFHATNLSNESNSLTEKDIDFLQGRSDSKTRQSYFFTDEKKLKRRYCESMNAVTIYNKYNTICDTQGNIFVSVYDPNDELIPLQEREVQLRKENQVLSNENRKLREDIKSEARKVFLELLEENNIQL